MKNKIMISVVAFLFLVLFVNFISAEEFQPKEDYKAPFDLTLWLQKTFGMNTFSVVGDARTCNLQPAKTITVPKGTSKSVTASEYCTSGQALIDVFGGNYQAYLWEEKNVGGVTCNSYDYCLIEVYCCSKPECTVSSNSGCGSSEKCTKVDCSVWSGKSYGSAPLYRCTGIGGAIENEIPYVNSYYNYCKQIEYTKCYYASGGTLCSERSYDRSLCPSCGQGSCSSYSGKTLYSDKSVCESHIPSGGPVCGNGVCESGETITSCASDCGSTCTPDCTNKCGGVSNGCGGTCDASCGSGKGDIRTNGQWSIVKQSAYLDDTATIRVPLKNFGDKEETINLEAGFYSENYAKDVADLFSTFTLFSSVPAPNCNEAEKFVQTREVTLAAGESETIEIEVVPYHAFSTYEKGAYNLNTDQLIVFYGLYKECLGGYINEAGTTGKGIMFDYSEYPISCSFKIGPVGGADVWCGNEKIGTCSGSTLTINEKCLIPLTVDVVNGTTPPVSMVDRTNLVGAKKIALTEKEISESTSYELLASACKTNDECFAVLEKEGEDASVSCISIAKLREKGVLSEADSSNFFTNAKTIVKGASYSAAGGIAACLLIGGGSLIAAPFTLGTSIAVLGTAAATCGSIGALVGGTATSIYLDLTKDDNLLDSLQASNENEVGICTKSSGGWCSFASSLGFIPITKDKCTDGSIFLGALAFLGMILLMKR